MTALTTACRTIRRTSRADGRRHTRAMAFHYNRHRDLPAAMGRLVPTPYGNDPEFTRRIIAALQTVLENQHPYARLRRKMVEVALAGEELILAHQEAERQAAE